jgi:hypothetical protein
MVETQMMKGDSELQLSGQLHLVDNGWLMIQGSQCGEVKELRG